MFFDNISFIDLRNGNNQNINYFYGYGSATNNTGNNHTCIYVNNPIWSSQNWTNVVLSFHLVLTVHFVQATIPVINQDQPQT